MHFETNPDRTSSPTGAIPQTLARPWAIPGTPGLEHRIGGLEKQDVTGNVNYEPLNHEKMVRLRAAKVEGIVQDVPDVVPAGDPDGDLLIVALGLDATAPITAALKAQRAKGRRIGHVHLRHLNPLPKNLGEVLGALRQRAGPGNEHGPARRCCCARSIWWTRRATTRFRASPSRQSEIEAQDRRDSRAKARDDGRPRL